MIYGMDEEMKSAWQDNSRSDALLDKLLQCLAVHSKVPCAARRSLYSLLGQTVGRGAADMGTLPLPLPPCQLLYIT